MSQEIREQMIEAATEIFAAKGYYGASLANIAKELGKTKQALLHYFPTKEKLYGEILGRISKEIMAVTETAAAKESDPRAKFETAIMALFAPEREGRMSSQIVVREIMDVEQRVGVVKSWYLKPYLDFLIGLLQAVPQKGPLTADKALALIYPVIGSMHYYAISPVVLGQLYGEDSLEYLDQAVPDAVRDQVSRMLDSLT